jgi:GNAT superfamily N-acetyltransferase
MELVEASGEQRRARNEVSFSAWGGPLTAEQFVAREERLCAHPWARRTMTSWLLVDGGAVLASCETYRMDGFVDGERGDVWAVASVFTEERLRRKRYASQLMQLLVERARRAGALASTLFSDVGPAIYDRVGYRARPAEDLLFPPAAGEPAAAVDALVHEALALEPLDADEGELVVWPTAEQLDWHLERTRTYASMLARPPLPSVGARAGDGAAQWSVDWAHERLLVLLLTARRAHEAEALVQAARRTAYALRLREVRLWAQPWPFVGRADLGGDRVGRRDSLPMIAPLAPSLGAEAWTQIPRAVWV